MAVITTQAHYTLNYTPSSLKTMANPLFVWLFSSTGNWEPFDPANQEILEDLWERGTHHSYLQDSHFNNGPVLIRLDGLYVDYDGSKLSVVRVLG